MWTRRSVGAILVLLMAGAMSLFAYAVLAQTLTWTPSTSYTDNTGKTGTFTSTEMNTMKFYLRARKQGDAAPRKYFGETGSGTATWSGDFATSWQNRGLGTPQPGEVWEITVSQAYKNPDWTDKDGNVIPGKELDSAESAVALYQFPFSPDRTADAPSAPVITE